MSGHWDESKLKRRIKELGAKNKRLAECEEVASRFNADLKAENKRLMDCVEKAANALVLEMPDAAMGYLKQALETDDENIR